MKRPDEGLVDCYGLSTTAERYVYAFKNVDECDDLQMLTSLFKYLFGDLLWSILCSTICSSYIIIPYLPNTLNTPLSFVI